MVIRDYSSLYLDRHNENTLNQKDGSEVISNMDSQSHYSSTKLSKVRRSVPSRGQGGSNSTIGDYEKTKKLVEQFQSSNKGKFKIREYLVSKKQTST
jgi:hypothetical protein